MNTNRLSDVKSFLCKRKVDIICSVAAVALILLVWAIAYYSVKNDYVIPSVSDTFRSFGENLISGVFWSAFFNTFLRTLIAFAVSFALAAATAALSFISKIFRALVRPFIVILRTLPTLAVILILLIWTTPRTAPVIVAALVLYPMMHARFFAALDGVDKDVLEMARVYNISARDRLLKIYLPQTLPAVLLQTGADISLGLKVVISAEVLSSTFNSLGGLMQNARLYLEMPRLAALTLAAVFFGLIIDAAFAFVGKFAFGWRKKEGGR